MQTFITILQASLGIAFLIVGGAHLSSKGRIVQRFTKELSLSKFTRIGAGLLELIGGAGLLAGVFLESATLAAGIGLAAMMSGALFTEFMRSKTRGSWMPPLILLSLTLAIIGLVLFAPVTA